MDGGHALPNEANLDLELRLGPAAPNQAVPPQAAEAAPGAEGQPTNEAILKLLDD